MNTSKVERYKQKLVELRELRKHGNDPEAEATVLEIMGSLWESMAMEERQYFSETNHLSWPPPRRDKKDSQ